MSFYGGEFLGGQFLTSQAGHFFGGQVFGGEFFFTPDVDGGTVELSVGPSLGGSKKRKVRGPYSDPRIFEEYIKRCIAEREAPRENTAVAALKEALIEQVDARRHGGVGADLARESQVIERLIGLENAKRAVAALKARQRQIVKQLEELEDEETSMLLALWNALED